MMSGTTRGSAGLETLQSQLTATLDGLEEQRWTVSEAFFRRSEVRSALGDRVGALEDANVALTLFPTHTKYLIRASSASFDVGLPYEAGQLLERANSSVDPRRGDEETLQSLSTIKSLERRLKPFNLVPDEILLVIFEYIQRDWERLPSPFQLSHVCGRWKRVAESAQSLWRDLRILRVSRKSSTSEPFHYPRLKTLYRLMTAEPTLDRSCTRQDFHHDNLIRLCSRRSHATLTHYELDVWKWEEGSDLLNELCNVAYRSWDTLERVAFVQGNTDERQRFADPRDIGIASAFAAVSFDAVMRCEKVSDVELSVGELLQGDDEIPDLVETAHVEPLPSFRRLQLDCFGGFSDSRRAQTRDRFLLRSSQLQSLSLRNLPNGVNLAAFDPNDLPFVLRLLVACANTLVHLEVDGHANIMKLAQAAGITSFPQLRSYRHVKRKPWSEAEQVRSRDMSSIAFPKLETLEAPANVIRSFPSAPLLHVVLRLQDRNDFEMDCKRFAKWLHSIDEEHSPCAITISEVDTYRSNVKEIIEALTPSHAGRVNCPRLVQLSFVSRPAYSVDSAGWCPSLDPAPLPPDSQRQEVSKVSSLVQLTRERARISQGLSPLEEGSSDGGVASWGRCEALSSIELDGWVFKVED